MSVAALENTFRNQTECLLLCGCQPGPSLRVWRLFGWAGGLPLGGCWPLIPTRIWGGFGPIHPYIRWYRLSGNVGCAASTTDHLQMICKFAIPCIALTSTKRVISPFNGPILTIQTAALIIIIHRVAANASRAPYHHQRRDWIRGDVGDLLQCIH